MTDLADVLSGLGEQRRVTRFGKVTSTSPFKVTFFADTDAVALPRLAAYTPAVNDRVLVIGDSARTMVVVGKVIPASSGTAINVSTWSY